MTRSSLFSIWCALDITALFTFRRQASFLKFCTITKLTQTRDQHSLVVFMAYFIEKLQLVF